MDDHLRLFANVIGALASVLSPEELIEVESLARAGERPLALEQLAMFLFDREATVSPSTKAALVQLSLIYPSDRLGFEALPTRGPE